jgi:hypothetical protein
MPLDPLFPKLALSVVPRTNGKANCQSNNHLKDLKRLCFQAGFLIITVCGDGDTAYTGFLTPIYTEIMSERGKAMLFMDHVSRFTNFETGYPFVTDFLHF